MHINVKRAGKRNSLKGGICLARSIMTNITKAKDIFSKDEIIIAVAAKSLLLSMLEMEPKNYISLRYKKSGGER